MVAQQTFSRPLAGPERYAQEPFFSIRSVEAGAIKRLQPEALKAMQALVQYVNETMKLWLPPGEGGAAMYSTDA
jgi:hypothetical protein